MRGNESELALKNKNYKSIKKFLNYLSVILQAIFFFFALVNESTDGIQTDVWDRALSSV